MCKRLREQTVKPELNATRSNNTEKQMALASGFYNGCLHRTHKLAVYTVVVLIGGSINRTSKNNERYVCRY